VRTNAEGRSRRCGWWPDLLQVPSSGACRLSGVEGGMLLAGERDRPSIIGVSPVTEHIAIIDLPEELSGNQPPAYAMR
jgi:hypothetical protein